MNKNLQTVFNYHQTTKHSQQRYARSLGYMDWQTQPNPFRNYNGADSFLLPLALQNPTPPYHLLDSDLPPAPLLKESLSQLLQFSMGIAAWKVSGDSSWAVRCNASSGNLHPTETYLILPPTIDEQKSKTTVFHYTPKDHGLEILSSFDTTFWDTLPSGSFLMGLSGISWREAWKYGERAFRYVNLDAGHALQSINVSSKMLGWKLTSLDSVSDADIATLLGLSQEKRFFEREHADMLFVVSPQRVATSTTIERLLQDVPLSFDGIANKLSPTMENWEIITEIENATSVMQIPQKSVQLSSVTPKPTGESKKVVMQRRSIHVMDKVRSVISKDEFHTLLTGVVNSLDGKENSAHLAIFVHRVKEYKSGIYILIRNQRDKEALKEKMFSAFKWTECDFEGLYLLDERDVMVTSQTISCSQEIASDGAFSLGMLCNFSEQLNTHGAHRYKELYWECGAIGQQLYLDATSMGLSGTGIGCFLDDMMHSVLGLESNEFQVLYHFTVGRGYVDSRIQTQVAYEER
ncbi:nitroreductase family protein [Sulfurimonas sp. SAG-AH-194-L11]|nr:nitroreductase family protein [Sulfurimonas sp. SAG-AH-194-L11]MDF1876562.1 nitroreductase family protein [Sulfurimonas sp. SAG-AH-194-L11]